MVVGEGVCEECAVGLRVSGRRGGENEKEGEGEGTHFSIS